MEAILAAHLVVPFWCSFRIPYAVNVHFTYPVPPLTTLKGVVAGALGLPVNCLEPLEGLSFGVGLESTGSSVETISSIIKRDYRLKNGSYTDLRTLVIREKLIKPEYTLYVRGMQERLETISARLRDPFFPLYLGESDDAVVVENVEIHRAVKTNTTKVDNCIPVSAGTPASDVELMHMPVAFKSKNRGKVDVEYQDYYVAPAILLENAVDAYEVSAKRVVL